MPRKNKTTSVSTVHLPLRIPTRQYSSLVLAEVIKHLLFTRGQISQPFDILQSLDKENDTTKPRSKHRGNRKRATFIAEAQALFQSLHQEKGLFSCTSTTTALFLLGTSSTAPREAYEIVFPPVVDDNGSSSSDEDDEMLGNNREESRKSHLDAHCRRLLREYAVQSFDLPEGSAAEKRCKAFLLFKSHHNGDESSSSRSSSSSVFPPSTFVQRRGWRLRMKKGTLTRIILLDESAGDTWDDIHEEEEAASNIIAHINNNNKQKAVEEVFEEQPQETVWLQSTAKLEGLVKPLSKNE